MSNSKPQHAVPQVPARANVTENLKRCWGMDGTAIFSAHHVPDRMTRTLDWGLQVQVAMLLIENNIE
jgi:hypothetical protein